MKPVFITGNAEKAAYLSKHLGVTLDHIKLDLDEIQSTSLTDIVEHKARQAYDLIKRPLLVEDVALGFEDLNGLPGPFIKFYVDAPHGLEKLCRMCDGLQNRKATASCTYAYFNGSSMSLFTGSLDGVISDTPRGEGGFGWDRVFCPIGYGGKTRAELSVEDDVATYTIIKPYAQLRAFLATL